MKMAFIWIIKFLGGAPTAKSVFAIIQLHLAILDTFSPDESTSIGQLKHKFSNLKNVAVARGWLKSIIYYPKGNQTHKKATRPPQDYPAVLDRYSS